MRAQPVRADEQYRLVMECRASGLTDYQWCMEHNIKPGTFYNWVKRLRKSGCADIPEHSRFKQTPKKQEIVRIELAQPAEPGIQEARVPAASSAAVNRMPVSDPAPAVLELALPEGYLRIPNGTDPALLRQTFLMLKGIPC